MKINRFCRDGHGLVYRLLAVILVVAVLSTTLPAVLLTPAVAQSQPGANWTAHPSGTTRWLIDVTWGDNRFVVVGEAGTILTSPDGVSWTEQDSGTGADLTGVAWGADQFVAVGGGGTILTSPDGVSWTVLSSGTNRWLYCVTWGVDQFVAVGGNVGDAGTILTSPDGVNWTEQDSGTTNVFLSTIWGANQFVAVGGGGTILTSPDGVSWTEQDSGMNGWLRGVTWGDNRFVIVGEAGTILTSPDGVNWTEQDSGTTNDILGTTWGSNQFVALAGSFILTSPDGVNWTQLSPIFMFTIPYSVTWGSGKFVAVGNNGMILTSGSGDPSPQICATIDLLVCAPELKIGQEQLLQMTFTNTGTETHTFIAGASLWKPGSDLTSSDVVFEKEVTLAPGTQTTVTWTHTVDVAGDWGYQFAVWKARPFIAENLLAKAPSPVGFFSVGDTSFVIYKVAYIPIKGAGQDPPVTVDQLKHRARLVEDYYLQQSYGKVKIISEFIFNEWKELNTSDSKGGTVIKEAIDFADVDTDSFDTTIVIQNIYLGPAYAEVHLREDEPYLVISDSDRVILPYWHPYQVYAHELGHTLFGWYDYYVSPGYEYSRGQIGYWGLMGTAGFTIQPIGTFGMGLQNPPSVVVSYNKQLQGWLNYSMVKAGETKTITFLMDQKLNDEVYRFETGLKDMPYYIFEGRNPGEEKIFIAKDPYVGGLEYRYRLNNSAGILIYQVEEKNKTINTNVGPIPFGGEHIYTIPSVNRAMLYPSRRVTLAPGDIYYCDLTRAKFVAELVDSRLTLKVKDMDIYEYATRIIYRSLIKSITYTSPFGFLGIFSNESMDNDYIFDIDLKVYTSDGLKVGMDYDAGEYLMQIPDARTSGNIPGGGSEWISVPAYVDVDYEIDTTPAKLWMEAAGIKDASFESEIVIAAFDEDGNISIIEGENISFDFFNIILTGNPKAGGNLSGGGVYELNQQATATAQANPGYVFTNWTEDGVIVSNNRHYSFTVASSRNLIANFIKVTTLPPIIDPVTPTDPKPDPVRKPGDITGNGKINIEDVNLAIKHILGLNLLTDEQMKAADVNGDGKVDIRDVVLIMRRVLLLIDSFPIEQ